MISSASLGPGSVITSGLSLKGISMSLCSRKR